MRITKNTAFRVTGDCIFCRICLDIAPHAFREDENGVQAEVYAQPCGERQAWECEEARQNCPVEAIVRDDPMDGVVRASP